MREKDKILKWLCHELIHHFKPLVSFSSMYPSTKINHFVRLQLVFPLENCKRLYPLPALKSLYSWKLSKSSYVMWRHFRNCSLSLAVTMWYSPDIRYIVCIPIYCNQGRSNQKPALKVVNFGVVTPAFCLPVVLT